MPWLLAWVPAAAALHSLCFLFIRTPVLKVRAWLSQGCSREDVSTEPPTGPSTSTEWQMGKLRPRCSECRSGLGLSHQLLWYLRHSRGLRGNQKAGSPDKMSVDSQQGSFQTCPDPGPTRGMSGVCQGWENGGPGTGLAPSNIASATPKDFPGVQAGVQDLHTLLLSGLPKFPWWRQDSHLKQCP